MGIELIVDLIHRPFHADTWDAEARAAFLSLFGAGGGRYPQQAEKSVAVRAPAMPDGVSFASLLHPSNPPSGAYGGMSFTIFPQPESPCLVTLVVGTQGLSPDEEILGRPGHARKVQAIATWLNKSWTGTGQPAWAKSDPTRIEQDIPAAVRNGRPDYNAVFSKYGNVLYFTFVPDPQNVGATENCVKALLDLVMQERGYNPLAPAALDARRIRDGWSAELLPAIDEHDLFDLLNDRRYVILEGPPGTGKTRMANRLLHQYYGGHGVTIQFHPNMTYENFVGGLAPAQGQGGLGFHFTPVAGALMRAATVAAEDPGRPYLLNIDEINRADLGKVLGEAIYLLEPVAERARQIELAYTFSEIAGRNFSLPSNLHILGTMNSADRSIAIVDVAVRRRFAFLKVWPQAAVVEALSCELMKEAFQDLVALFVEHAPDEAFNLLPGHSYFLERDTKRAIRKLNVELAPLLEEYLAQGYVGGFSNEITAYLQGLRGRDR